MGMKYLISSCNKLDNQSKRVAIYHLKQAQLKLDERGSLSSKYEIADIQQVINLIENS